MLREGIGFKKIVVRCGRTDMRRGITGLVTMIRLEYGMDTFEEGTLFLFCGHNRSCIKGVIYEGDGYLLLTKRLSDGVYQWPRDSDEARVLSSEEFKRLMDGFAVESSIRSYKKIIPENKQ